MSTLLSIATGTAKLDSPTEQATRDHMKQLSDSIRWFFENGVEVKVKTTPKGYQIVFKKIG